MSDGSAQSSAPASSAGTASFDRTAGAQRWGEGGPEREKSRSLKPLMRLMPYIKRQQTTAVLAIIFLFVAAALNLAITFPVQWLGNNAFQTFDPAMINNGFMAMIGIALLLGVTSAIRFYYFSRFGERLAADLRGDVYARLMSLSPAYFSKLRTGEAVSRLTADVTLIETFFGSTFSMAVRSCVTSIGALVLMMITSWKLTLILFVMAPVARMTRASMLGVLSADFVRTARAMGLSRARVLYGYAFRNAFLPVLTTIGMVFSFMLGANVLVEKVFAWPGIGSFAIESLVASDYAPVQGFVLTMAILYVALNLVIDLLYLAIDPRVSVAG